MSVGILDFVLPPSNEALIMEAESRMEPLSSSSQ